MPVDIQHDPFGASEGVADHVKRRFREPAPELRKAQAGHLSIEGSQDSCPFQGFTPGLKKSLIGGLNGRQPIGYEINGNPIYFEYAREKREHLERL